MIGEGYSTSQVQVGDYFDVLTAGSVTVGSINLSFVNLPTTNWYYGVVAVAGGEALRIEYGASPVPEPSALCLLGVGLAGLLVRRRRAV